MKILASLALLVSVNAFACPDLTGSFTCQNQDGTMEKLSVSQADKDGVTTYSYNNEAIPADNQVYKMEDSQQLKSGTFRAWCDDKTPTVLSTEILGKYYQDGSYFGDLTLDTNFSLDTAMNLHEVTTGMVKNDGGTYPINNDQTCTRDQK